MLRNYQKYKYVYVTKDKSSMARVNSLWPSDAICQHWLRQWLVAWRHQAITWTNVDWSSVKSSDIHIRAISKEMTQPSITKICLKITCLKCHSNFPGVNELISCGLMYMHTLCHVSKPNSQGGLFSQLSQSSICKPQVDPIFTLSSSPDVQKIPGRLRGLCTEF